MLGQLVRSQIARSLMLALSAATAAVVTYLPIRGHQGAQNEELAEAQGSCPVGYTYEDPLEVAGKLNPAYAKAHESDIRKQFGEHFCFAKDFALLTEREESHGSDSPYADMPEGALRPALEVKAQLTAQQASIPFANGHWETYAKTVLVNGTSATTGYDSQSGNGGILYNSARVDSFSWDSVNKRLFSSGPGGIWMTQAVNGDVSTLATQASPWKSVGDNLPIQLVSQAAWTPAAGGRLIALTGEQTIGGGIMYTGLGAYWSGDLGKTWTHSNGVPDGAMAFRVAVDGSNPSIIYVATSKGLFRSTDAGVNFANVNLPVSSDCAGTVAGKCQFANVVTDVVVKKPGGMSAAGVSTPLGVTCGANGCPVLAAVGYYRGAAPYSDGLGTPRSPGNGLYRSDSGQPGSFARVGDVVPPGTLPPTITNQSGLTPAGFASQERIGRIQLGAAIGDAQDHNYIYANVQDAILITGGGFTGIDLDVGVNEPTNPIDPACNALPAGIDPTGLVATTCSLAHLVSARATYFNGIYVSPDFGSTWVRLLGTGDMMAIAPASGSTLGVLQALGYGPGIQSWYNNWIKPDPTQGVGAPTRFEFGLEEVWQYAPVTATSTTASPQFKVIGTYLAGQFCAGLSLGAFTSIAGLPPPPACPIRDGFTNDTTTTHPDQHDGIFIPDGNGGVWLFVGHDGGVNKQYSANPLTDPFTNTKWGQGSAYNANWGMFTLLPWGISVAADGTVYSGHQDNAMGRIDAATREWDAIGGGDGGVTAVDPNNSNTAYFGGGDGGNFRTFDGGKTRNGDVVGGQGGVTFVPAFKLDPLDANHMVGANTSVGESLDIAAATQHSTTVFDLGADAATGAARQAGVHALDVQGGAVYVGWCGPCSVPVPPAPGKTFRNGIATNVGGPLPPQKGTSISWHFASAAGLPNRYVYVAYIDPQDATNHTVYVGLGSDYNTARWSEAGVYLDSNPNIGAGHLFVSFDAAETFTNVSGNLPNVEVSAIVRRGNQLIVGTQVGVFISSDLRGSNWTPLGDGPGASTAIQNLILQPGNSNHLFAGTYGRGVQLYDFSTTNAVCAAPTIEDDDASIAYTPGWHLVQNAAASAGHFRLNAGGDNAHTASLSFTVPPGSQGAVTYFFAQSQNGGTANVYFDAGTTPAGTINFYGGTAQNKLKSPAFGVNQQFGSLAAGTHTLKIVPNGDGAVYVDGFCLANATKGAAATSGPGATNASSNTLAPGQSTSNPVTLPTGTTTLSVLTQSTGGSAKTLILNPLGTVVGTLNAVSGITTVDLPSPTLGSYTIQTLNTDTSSVDVWTVATPQVQR
jgi:hypothetical protein